MTAEDRYRDDIIFHNLVDNLELLVSQGVVTPSELRIAVILAATHYEMRRTDIRTDTGWFIDNYGVKRTIMEDIRNVKKVC